MKIKQIYDDFIVKEVSEINLGRGNYAYFILEKWGIGTPEAIGLIAKKANVEKKFINFAGLKDKNAHTFQYISCPKFLKAKLEKLKFNRIKLKFLGYGKKRIGIGDLKANEFVITIRDLEKPIEKKVEQIPNYFDEQRFGTERKNHIIGKLIIKKEFEKVCELLNLKVEEKDYINSLRKIGIRNLRFYISAYQSYLFNKLLSNILKRRKHIRVKYSLGNFIFPLRKLKNKKIDIPGFLHYKGYKLILKKEKIRPKDFIINEIPELSSEGDKRDMLVKVKNFKILGYSKDELNKGKFKEKISFLLPKGSYGTLVLKFLASS